MNVATTRVATTSRARPFPVAKVGRTALAWVVAFIFFFPVLWMVLTAFKQEGAAQTYPPKLVFDPTLNRSRPRVFCSLTSGLDPPPPTPLNVASA